MRDDEGTDFHIWYHIYTQSVEEITVVVKRLLLHFVFLFTENEFVSRECGKGECCAHTRNLNKKL